MSTARQSEASHTGDTALVSKSAIPTPAIDIRALRERLGFSLASFAEQFGFSNEVLRDLERGHKQPDNAIRAYLLVISKEPEAVLRALGRHKLSRFSPEERARRREMRLQEQLIRDMEAESRVRAELNGLH